ncbi:hypothetical protein Poli38472_005392 [Pythium oligandrum]|uniref:Uncharacterized protein n=1 Tax=Pythium oligandrum TaxID=41045 RepID=A0A8K1FJ56_PYTOL|nr:hypothetical protein Poli38472_005392 [Pythium oligandrum]|eukprot:TMW62774.1 hypothetical protein Poli38472_005392 [Pythium oligandrum]
MDEQEDDEVRRQERVRLPVRRRNYEKDTPIALQAPRPSAYAYYKKLVQDFENLDTELQEQHATQERLQADLERNKAKYEAHERERQQRERQEWERRRDRDMEEICEQSNVLEKIRHEYSELEEEELRLQAELEVLQEKQHEANQTEAHRISKLVHDRGSILDEEIAKGRMDIEFITKIVTTANRAKQEQSKTDIGLHAVVNSIQQRRQDAFREAAARFHERLHSFELEREALRQKTDEIKWKKQRALKILSTNQQEVIKGFFVTPREALNEANPRLPVLDFGSILDTLSQSGDTVRRLQGEDNVRQSARRQLDDALSEAKRNLELGPQKLDELQQRLRQHEQEAQRLERLLSSAETPYDERWSVETYSTDQLSIVYYLRTLIFRWIEEAVETARCQPERSLLEMEIRRAEQTRVAFAAQEQRDRTIRAAVAVQIEWMDEVIEEMVRSIHQELSYSAEQVRSVINNASRRLFFPSLNAKDGKMKPAKASATPPGVPAPTLRWAMFESTWDELKSQRKMISMTRPSKVLMMHPAPRDIAESNECTQAIPLAGEKASTQVYNLVTSLLDSIQHAPFMMIKEVEQWRLGRACCLYYLFQFDEAERESLLTQRLPLCNRLLYLIAHRRKNGELVVLDRYKQLSMSSMEDQLALAFTSMLQHNYQEAVEIYKRLLQQHREHSGALQIYLAMCYFCLDYYDVSLEVLAVYLEAHPESFVAANLKASNQFRLYSGLEANEELENFLHRHPNHPCVNDSSTDMLGLHSVMQHNKTIFMESAGIEQHASLERSRALSVLQSLVDRIPEAKMNLVLAHLQRHQYRQAFELVEDVEPVTPTEHIVKGVLHATIGEQTNSKEHTFLAEKYFHTIGSSPSECDTIPGRQCMASYHILRKEFTDANVYLSSIATYLISSDVFNWNYGISLAASGNFQEAEDVLTRVHSERLRTDLAYCSWLARAYIMNGKNAGLAWELYLKMENTADAFKVLKLIANDYYRAQLYYFAVKAFDVLERLDPDPEFWEAKRGACLGYFQQVALGHEPLSAHRCDEVLKLLLTSKNVVESNRLGTMLKKWVQSITA